MLQLGPLVLDFNPLLEAAAASPLQGAWFIFKNGGWAVFVLTFLIGFKWMWLEHIANKHASTWKWVLLAIDIPAENIQSPKAVENILAHLAGAHKTPDLIEAYITGYKQPFFSLEIVSTAGFVRFYIYTITKLRNLAEAAIYAQYPSAEISEAPDYTPWAPTKFPDTEWTLWGTEFKLTKHYAYPLRTYEAFKDETAEEAMFKDPMAALLETMSSNGPDEHLWMQILITPIRASSWQDKSYRIVEKLAGIPSEHKPSWLGRLLEIPGHLGAMMIDAFLLGSPEHTAKVKDDMPSKMLYLTPGEREVIQAIEDKAAKIGFHTKIRVVHLSKKGQMVKARGQYGISGAMKQVNTEDMNALKIDTKKVGTHAHYVLIEKRKDWRRTKIIRAYKARSNWRGLPGFILNTEELATLWHFPVAESVKAPLIKKAESKRGAPPYEIPTLHSPHHGAQGAARSAPPDAPPKNLPVG